MNIIFVSEMQDPYTRGSSTQIMTLNILHGLKKLGNTVIFIAITDKSENTDNIYLAFNNLVDKVICVPSRLNLSMNPNKYVQLLLLLRSFFFPHKYPIAELCSFSNVPLDTLLISHNPPFEAAMVAREIQKKLSLKKYYQYWSDPYALAGILPESFGYKRYLSFLMEACILQWAAQVIYGTRTLCYFQQKMFPFYREKMRYVDVSHSGENSNTTSIKYTVGYFGGYVTRYRNIIPFYQVIKKHPEWSMLICGTGIPPVKSCNNIIVHERIPQAQIANYENLTDIHVTLLNFNNIQIPGKIFYKTNQNITILVVLDGKYKDLIRQYLTPFERFEFCENNEADIEAALRRITAPDYRRLAGKQELLSPARIATDLLAGGKICQ